MEKRREKSKLLSLAIIVLILCGVALVRVKAETTIGLTNIGSGTYRWKDIADHIYTASYQSSYSYSDAVVTVKYDEASHRFKGSLEASNLKPYFAYQLKLEGIVASPGNEELKSIGRTWNGIGYLIFDYFVTDGTGVATLNFEQDSSYHVLWTTQRTPEAVDGPIITTTFTANIPPHSAYSGGYSEKTVEIYGERENSHVVGFTFLPVGHYVCKVVITEESFHQDDTYGGDWAGAMQADIEFDIIPEMVIPEMPYGTITALIIALSALLIVKPRILGAGH